MNETLKILKERRSVRRYEARPVEREKLDAILEAGKYAPSAKGQQSVTMVVLTKREDIAELSALNAAVMGTSSDPFFGAPCVVVVLADPEATNAANAQRDGSLTGRRRSSRSPRARPCCAAGACRSASWAWATASWATPQGRSPPPSPGRRTS